MKQIKQTWNNPKWQLRRMKNLSLLVVTTFMVLIASCKDETSQTPVTNYSSITAYNDNINYSNITYYGGLLVFDTDAELTETIAELLRQYDEHDDWFLDQYDTLDDDSINAIETIIGHNSNLPYETFEGSFIGFTSLRKSIYDLEESWLASSDDLVIAEDPDDHFIVSEDLRSVLNTNVEVATENKVYKFYEDYYLELTGGGLDTLLELRDSLNDGVIDTDNLDYGTTNHQTLGIQIIIFKVGNGAAPPGCNPKTLRRKADFEKNTSNTRKIKWVLWIENIQLTSGNAHAKTKNYKKKKNGKWKKYRTNVNARCHGDMTDPNGCTTHAFDCQTATKKKRKIKVTGCVVGLTKALPGDVKGVHNGAEGVGKSSVLTW
ncbi:MAG: hypothetical protein ACI8ZM_005640 [Crocinitomix sp.]|jgi:hypothetical protein